MIHSWNNRGTGTFQEVATQPSSQQTSAIPQITSVPTGLNWTPSCGRPGPVHLGGIAYVLAQLVGAGAETGLVLLEKVGLGGQWRLQVTDNENTWEESEALSERWPSHVFLQSHKIRTFK